MMNGDTELEDHSNKTSGGYPVTECKRHHWPNEEGECPYCEIDRLQTIIAGDPDLSIAEWHSDRVELLKCIGKLEDENTQLKQGYTAIRNDMGRVAEAAKKAQQENKDIKERVRIRYAQIQGDVFQDVDELKRLRQQIDRLCDDNVKLNDEYDELNKRFTSAAAYAEELELGTEELNNQIEDLEKYKERAAEIFVEKDRRIMAIWEEHGYKITTEQINKAWGYWRPLDPTKREALIFQSIGITACEECGGSGKRKYPPMSIDVPNVCPPCAKRGSNGWQIDRATRHNSSDSVKEEDI
jgi:regulator of replication initiation timing